MRSEKFDEAMVTTLAEALSDAIVDHEYEPWLSLPSSDFSRVLIDGYVDLRQIVKFVLGKAARMEAEEYDRQLEEMCADVLQKALINVNGGE